MSSNSWNCTSFPPLEANPDIGGIGTIIAFVVSVYLTLFCCIAKASIDHLRSPDKLTPKLDIWSFVLGNTILSFSDQQVVTGISVLIGGITQLRTGLDSYHWQTVINLAWFSAFTHIITLTALRAEYRSNQKVKKIKKIRLVAMGILAVMLICMMYTVGWTSGENYDISVDPSFPPDGFPAWCLFHLGITPDYYGFQYNWPYVTLALLMLIISYSTRALLLCFDSIGEAASFIAKFLGLEKLFGFFYRLGIPRIKSIEVILGDMSSSGVGYRILRSLYTVFLACEQVFASTIWELGWLTFALVWGSVRIFTVRSQGTNSHYYPIIADILSAENTWAFGQVISLLLLVLPFISFYEAYSFPPEARCLQMKPAAGPQVPFATSTGHRGVLAVSSNLFQNSSTSLQMSQIREEIIVESWFSKLVICVYLLCAVAGVLGIYLIPGENGANGGILTTGNGGGGPLVDVVLYIMLIFWDLGILWVTTLVFIDRDAQRLWGRSRLGRMLAKKALVCWSVVIFFVLALSTVVTVVYIFGMVFAMV